MTPQRVTLITLGVSDLLRSREFYKAMGWRESGQSQENVAFFQINGMALGLFGMESLAEDQGRKGKSLGTGAISLAQNFTSPRDVDEAFNRAVKCGATMLKKPQNVFWGGYSGYYADPDGHAWEVAYNPFWPLEEDGSLRLPN
ncbi:MAG: VOC family protein [Roseovarius sp.]|nr:VOC family protein [Roseovarius sp.]MCY4207681.1 VOC family protein [Roseovarius sp.]MCY4292045.1 VOC family protein [Roseovarius sp.]MCY4317339.1 VOC family protein [Roseovarius sp.]